MSIRRGMQSDDSAGSELAVARRDSRVAPSDSSSPNTRHGRADRYPIRAQLTAPLALVGVGGLAIVAASYGWLASRATSARIEQRLQGVVRVLDQSTYPLTDAVLRQMAELSGARLVLTGLDGRVLASSQAVPSSDHAKLPPHAGGAYDDDVALGSPIKLSDGSHFHTAVSLHRRPHTPQRRVLHVLFPSRDYNAAWRAAFVPPLAVGGLMVGATALVVNTVAGRVGSTLGRLGASVGRLAEGASPSPLATRWNDETRDLGQAIERAGDRMRLYEADLCRTERVRAVAMLGAGLAHEMRNAATGCRLALDLHSEGCRGADSDDCLEVARRQLQMLEGRLQQLLQLGREPEDSPTEAVDVGAVVGEAVEVARASARHHKIRLEWDGAKSPRVRASRQQLLQSVVNLLLNAVEAASRGRVNSPDDAFVRVELASLPDECELRVIDNGGGLDLPDGVDCFEPFVSQKPEGIGMGLWVCRTVVENAGGRVGYRREGGATVFAVQLPTVPPEHEEQSDA